MKLFVVEYQVQFKDGKETMTIKDKVAIPGKTPKSAQAMFLKLAQCSWGLVMPLKDGMRLMAPLRDMAGEITVLSCGPLSK